MVKPKLAFPSYGRSGSAGFTWQEELVLNTMAKIIHANPRHPRVLKAAASQLGMTYSQVKHVLERVRRRYLKAREFCDKYCYYRRRFNRKYL